MNWEQMRRRFYPLTSVQQRDELTQVQVPTEFESSRVNLTTHPTTMPASHTFGRRTLDQGKCTGTGRVSGIGRTAPVVLRVRRPHANRKHCRLLGATAPERIFWELAHR